MTTTRRESLAFETPENVRVRYRAAGLGTRFLAWLVDQVFVWLSIILILILLIVAAVSFGAVYEDLIDVDGDEDEVLGYFLGIFMVIAGLGSFVYFTVMELAMRGQTIGKRLTRIRVVKVDGFALDSTSILLRNIFRIIDNFPLMWIIPVVSKRSQRAGDMVGGTVVITDDASALTGVRMRLADRGPLDAEFRFDSPGLQRLSGRDFEAIEQLLDRWDSIPAEQRDQLAARLVAAVVAKTRVPEPPQDRRATFLEDLFAAELRRQARALG